MTFMARRSLFAETKIERSNSKTFFLFLILSFVLNLSPVVLGYSTTTLNNQYARPFGIEDFSPANTIIQSLAGPANNSMKGQGQDTDISKTPKSTNTPGKKWKSYDLGIGKNAPIMRMNKEHQSNEPEHNNPDVRTKNDVAEFWTPYESVRDYPSPQFLKIEMEESSLLRPSSTSNKKRNLPRMKFKRRSIDALTIETTPSTTISSPSIASSSLSAPMSSPPSLLSQDPEQEKETIGKLKDASISRLQKKMTTTNSSHQNASPSFMARRTVFPSGRKEQLDVNTVWVEMLIHNYQQLQLQQSQTY